MQEDKYKGMRGEFKGDFTRDTFDPINQYSRVLMQQGRVQLDADWNEQTSIMLHHLRSLACDLGSEHWGPKQGIGFEITPLDDGPDFSISPGHYYVNGILCAAGLDDEDKLFRYSTQPHFPVPDSQTIKYFISTDSQSLLIYLDVWERHITYLEDDSIRELALGGPDTATRAQVVWQVKAVDIAVSTDNTGNNQPTIDFKQQYSAFLTAISEQRIKPGTGKLCAKVKDKKEDTDPCLVAPESRYRGAENQLYRVEVHHSSFSTTGELQTPTFKWSRENASVTFPLLAIEGEEITLEHLGRDCRYGLEENDWVEIIDDEVVLRGEPGLLVQVVDVSREELKITVQSETALPSYLEQEFQTKNVLIRRWDQKKTVKEGRDGIVIVESNSPAEEHWIDLEDGIQIQFKGNDVDAAGNQQQQAIYQTGDYWLIPARTATADVEWPKDSNGQAKAKLPHGVIHHYAPLAIINLVDGSVTDLRRILKQLWE